MSRRSLTSRRAAAWLAALVVAAACSAGVDRMVGPRRLPGAPSLSVAASSPYYGLVISQVYGGGGNSGATYRNDFVELYNGSDHAIDLTGLSIQYASAANAFSAITPLRGSVESGHYFLIREAAGAGGTVSLPTPDLIPTGKDTIAMSATSAKVALATKATAISGCADAAVVDLVSYGSTSCFEGSAPVPALTNTTAAIRKDGGRQDTDNNSADFTTGAPTPRNTSSTPLPPLSVLAVTIAPANSSALVGSTVAFVPTATKSGPVAISAQSWTSSATGVATIDATTGVATAVAPGTTTIGVTVTTAFGTVSGSTQLTVTTAPTKVTLSSKTWTMKLTATKQFTATAIDAGGNTTPSSYSWTSSDPSVATVDATGLARPLTIGTTWVKATTPNGIADSVRVDVSSLSLQARTDPFPVGFQSQLFLSATGSDRNGNPVGNADLRWSSSDPTIVAVNDSTGVITARDTGLAIITATAKSDGISRASTTLRPTIESVGANARTGHNTELGVPTDGDASDDVIIARRQYTISYNPNHGDPNWVSWNLDATHKGSATRCNCFTADTALTRLGYKAYDTADWVNGGVWSRGHMSPSADWQDAEGDNAPTFFLSNMLPQNQTMNAGAWGDLENRLRAIAVGSTEIYIVAGGIFTKGRTNGVDGFGYMAGTGHILVPDSIFKLAIVVPDGRDASAITSPSDLQVIAVKMPNEASATGTYDRYVTTIDAIQKSTGYDFLSALPEKIQCRLESRNCAPTAALSASSLSADEGSTLTFDGSGSADPDNETLTYTWQVAGATVGNGSSLHYTFSNDGAYQVRLIVADPSGAADTASTTVSIRNVAPSVNAFAGASIDEGGIYAATGSFTDPGDDLWSATVDYGDGSGVQPLALDGKSFALSHAYADNGSYTVTVTVVERSASAASGARSATVVVANVAPAVSGLPASTILRGERYVAAGTFTDPGVADAPWSATVDYGDGASAELALSGSGFSLDHAYATAGTYTVTVRVTDKDGGVGTSTARVVVQSAAQGIDNLSMMVGTLGLSNGEQNSLRAKLRAAAADLRRDNSAPSGNVLDAFQNELNALVRSGRVSESAAAPVVAYAARVIASL